MSKISLKVAGMHCGNCSASIDKALALIPGVKAKADHEQGLVELEVEDESKLPRIKEAIEDLGFDVVG